MHSNVKLCELLSFEIRSWCCEAHELTLQLLPCLRHRQRTSHSATPTRQASIFAESRTLAIGSPTDDDSSHERRPPAQTARFPPTETKSTVNMSHESVWYSRPRTYGKGSREWYDDPRGGARKTRWSCRMQGVES